MILKLNATSLLKTIWLELAALAFVPAFAILFFKDPGSPRSVAIALFMLAYLDLPSFFLLRQYIAISKRVILQLDDSESKMTLETPRGKRTFKYDEVSQVRKVCARSIAQHRSTWFMFSSFYYFRIVLRSGEEIVVTCLMTDLDVISVGENRAEFEIKEFIVPIPTKNRNLLNLK